jgi:hypothetical protein
MLSPKLEIGCKTWAKKGKGFWQSFEVSPMKTPNKKVVLKCHPWEMTCHPWD